MRCREIQSLLPDFLEGKSSRDEETMLNDHLLRCVSCREEADGLRRLMADIRQIRLSAPAGAYWSSALSRIHLRIEKRSSFNLPGWMIRCVLPATAAVLLLILLTSHDVLRGNAQDEELLKLLHQLSLDEIQEVEDITTYNGEIDAASTPAEQNELSGNDKEVLKHLLQSEEHAALYTELDADEALNVLSEQEEELLLSALQQIRTMN